MKKLVLGLVIILSAMSFSSFGSEICVGQELIRTYDWKHYQVRVLAVYEDGTADVSYLDGSYENINIRINELSEPLDRLNGIEVGQELIRTYDWKHNRVRVLAIYKDGTADVTYLDGSYKNINVKIKELSAPLSRLNGIEIGQELIRTYDWKHYQVRVLAVYKDGTADVTYLDGSYENINIKINELSEPLESLNGIEVGQELIRTYDSKHYQVRVLAIYKDGTADVVYLNGRYKTTNIRINELSRPLRCVKAGKC